MFKLIKLIISGFDNVNLYNSGIHLLAALMHIGIVIIDSIIYVLIAHLILSWFDLTLILGFYNV